jgi:hypothetical protein
MRLTWTETTPLPTGDQTAELSPLLYSIDVFLPFVNLHQQQYWWPDATATGQFKLLGQTILWRGVQVRIYLWLQIIAG